MKERHILHSDANCFYASVEMVLNPSLVGEAVAVCGSTENRHGIVLAKSEKAKKAGVKTGMANWQARECCKDLIVVEPQYDYYLKFSKLLHGIYKRYTDLVEPFGMDECWIDITDCKREPMEIAEEIRKTVKEELGLTVSIGVSFNKVFAKLGSDMKKPDAITEITKDNYKEKVWPLPCSDLLYCGPSTTEKLSTMCVKTIGDLARQTPDRMQHKFGKNGLMLWNYANGLDNSRVAHQDYIVPAKSVGHGITCKFDVVNDEEVEQVVFALVQEIGYKLRTMNLRAKGVQTFIRDNKLFFYGWQTPLEMATQNSSDIGKSAIELIKAKYDWHTPIRAITVSAIRLERADSPIQPFLFYDYRKMEKINRLERAVDGIRERFGKYSIQPAIILNEKKMPKDYDKEIIMPGFMYQ